MNKKLKTKVGIVAAVIFTGISGSAFADEIVFGPYTCSWFKSYSEAQDYAPSASNRRIKKKLGCKTFRKGSESIADCKTSKSG